MPTRSLFIFRNDLRLSDNTALLSASLKSDLVVPLFIIDPALLSKWAQAKKRIAFMSQSLEWLERSIGELGGRMMIRVGDSAEVLAKLLTEMEVEAVHLNRDYTPWARRRDRKIQTVCRNAEVPLFQYADRLLNEPEVVAKLDGKPYSKFTPFYRRAGEHFVPQPETFDSVSFDSKLNTETLRDTVLSDYLDPQLLDIIPGCPGATAQLQKLSALSNYPESKEYPFIEGTSGLSVHLRFGTCSVRQAYHGDFGSSISKTDFLRQLYWRDFYYHVGFHFPHVYEGAFRQRYDGLVWNTNANLMASWRNGETGFPIVDAGLRELAATGHMHNRVRMIVASFLTKNLQIDWRAGEQHFASLLLDYDPAINNGNWQWSASTGCDAQPYFRIFNPWRQQRKFDPDCRYIKAWVPELEQFSARRIHNLEKDASGYITPIVDLKTSVEASKQRFKALANK